MVADDYDVRILSAVVDENYTEQILAACSDALLFAVSSMTCYQIRDGLNVSAAVKAEYPLLPIVWGGYHPSTMPEQTPMDMKGASCKADKVETSEQPKGLSLSIPS